MLYFIGLGLGDHKDISINGLEAIKACTRIYLDAYTSIFSSITIEELEAFYGKKVTLAHREIVESESDQILSGAVEENVAFLVVGDPFGATTHTDLYMRATKQNISIKIIHNTSIINAVASCGLQLYSYGPIVSIPFFTENWKPASWLDKIIANRARGQHTLCLLDIKVREQSEENLFKGRLIYEPPRFMTITQAAAQITALSSHHSDTMLAVGMMRVGANTSSIAFGTIGEIAGYDGGGPLHSLIIPGFGMHEIEFEMLKLHTIPGSALESLTYQQYCHNTQYNAQPNNK